MHSQILHLINLWGFKNHCEKSAQCGSGCLRVYFGYKITTRGSLMALLIKASSGGDNRILSPDSSLLKRPSVVPSTDRLSSSCYGKVQGEIGPDTRHSPRQSQSAHSKLSTVSLKRSNSSNVPQMSELGSKPQPPLKRPAVLSTRLKSDSGLTFARSNFAKSKTPGPAAGSTQDKMVAKTTSCAVPGQSKPLVSRSLKTTQTSNSTPSRLKNLKVGAPALRGSGPTTADVGTKGIPTTPNLHGTKSLKDHLAEIRGSSTPRRGLNANMPLRKPFRMATAGASFRRAGAPTSLIPKTKEGSRSPCEEELLVLRQRFSAGLAGWNKVFEVLCVFAQWSLNSRDRLIKEHFRCEDTLRSQLKLRLEECAQFEVQIKELMQQHAENQREKAEMWEKERQIMQIDMENLRVDLRTEKEKEVNKVLLQRDADISELQKAYENQLSEERRKWAARVAESHQKFARQFDQQQIDHESQIAELKRLSATRVAELENSLKSTELEFSAKVNRLQSECGELRRLSEGAQKNASEAPQQIVQSTRPEMSDFSMQIPSLPDDESPTSKERSAQSFSFDNIPISMTRSCCTPRAKVKQLIGQSQTPESTNNSVSQEEIESLKTVLELKSAEAAELRLKTMQLEEELAIVKEMNKEIKELQNRNENLEALLELRAESQKQLQDRLQNMFHNLEKEIRDKKKLKTECESLRFKLLDAHHKIDQLNTSNASEDDSFDLTDPLCMSRSLYSDPRAINPLAVVSGRSPRRISGTPKSPADVDDRLPAGSFISLDTRPASSSMRLRRGLQHDRSKRRTLATSAELERHTRH
ncbi:hypothetical protein TcWFU_000979 [Taenia crassiceps]|uniref:Microtubule associated tumor suppressor 1 n=1 Tax=Taenia crassiceps TaxID=6207 RepID=A0ABR4QP15_9CEST